MSMSTSTEVIAHHWAFAIFLIVAIGLCCLMLLGAFFLGGRARARAKNTPFESGIDSVGTARLRLSAKFYLVAMFFVIFDVEALIPLCMVDLHSRKWLGGLCRGRNFHFSATGRSGLSGAYWRAGLDACAFPTPQQTEHDH